MDKNYLVPTINGRVSPKDIKKPIKWRIKTILPEILEKLQMVIDSPHFKELEAMELEDEDYRYTIHYYLAILGSVNNLEHFTNKLYEDLPQALNMAKMAEGQPIEHPFKYRKWS